MTVYDDELPVQDLRALLDYNWSSEARDYQENPDDRHIFLAMRRLYDWLEDFTPDSRRQSYAHVEEIDGNSFDERVQTALVDARLVLRRLESGAAITPSEVNSALAGIDSVMT
jgi:hypothetical protein